jgi:hypothetical protein
MKEKEKTNKNPWISKLERNKNLTSRKKTVGVVKKKWRSMWEKDKQTKW